MSVLFILKISRVYVNQENTMNNRPSWARRILSGASNVGDAAAAMSRLRDELNQERQAARKVRTELIEKTAAFDEHLAECDATRDKLRVLKTRLEQKSGVESRLLSENTRLQSEVERLRLALDESQKRESALEKRDLDVGSRALELRQDLATAKASSGATVAEVSILREGIEERDLVVEQLTGRVKTMEKRLSECQNSAREQRAEEHSRREKIRKRLLEAEHDLTTIRRERAEEIERAREQHESMERKMRDAVEKVVRLTDEVRRAEARERSAKKIIESHGTVVKDMKDRVNTLRMQLDVEQQNVERLREESTKERRVATMLRARLDAQRESEKDIIKSLQQKEEEIIRLTTRLKAKSETEAVEKERVARDKAAALDVQDALLDVEEKLAKSEAQRKALRTALTAAEKKIAEQVGSWAASHVTRGSSTVDSLRKKLAISEKERMRLASVLLKVMRSKTGSEVKIPMTTSPRVRPFDVERTLPRRPHSSYDHAKVLVDESSVAYHDGADATGAVLYDQENVPLSNTPDVAARALRRLENVLARGEEFRGN